MKIYEAIRDKQMFNFAQNRNTPALYFTGSLRAAAFPYILSIAIMSVGCPLGIPFRFAFDALNIALLVSFVNSVVRLYRGHAFGPHTYGFTRPHFTRPRSSDVGPLFKGCVLMMLPSLLVFVALMLSIAPTIAALDNVVVTVMSRVTPMYILGLLLGWIIATTTSRA